MLTREQILEADRESSSIDGRDIYRLLDFFSVSDWEKFGVSLKEGVKEADVDPPIPWTEENILKQLASDVAFGFEKALGQRGLSASMMNDVVKMWMWILEDDLQHHDGYAMYGLPLLKAVALKYSLPNEIGDDSGSESKYGEY